MLKRFALSKPVKLCKQSIRFTGFTPDSDVANRNPVHKHLKFLNWLFLLRRAHNLTQNTD